MAALAGETIIAGQVPGERIATTVRTANSDGTTNVEIVVDTVVAPLVAGRTYKITWHTREISDVSADDITIRIREDSLTGNALQNYTYDAHQASRAPRTHAEAEFTATVTEDKTFVGTIDRFSGTGTVTSIANATAPAYLYVDYIRG